MTRLLRAAAALVCAWGALAAAARLDAQTTTITASHERIGGYDISTGTVTFTPVDNLGIPIAFADASGAQNGPTAFQCAIANGAITGMVQNNGSVAGSCIVPDTALTTPANLKYQATVCDTTSGLRTSKQCFTLQGVSGVTGATWALDHYGPPAQLSNVQLASTLYFNGAPSGACTQPQFAVNRTASLFYICVNAGWVPVNAGPTGPAGPPVTFRGAWNSGTTYAIGDAVSYTDGSSYVSLTAANSGNVPLTDSTDWALLAKAGNTLGTTYTVGATPPDPNCGNNHSSAAQTLIMNSPASAAGYITSASLAILALSGSTGTVDLAVFNSLGSNTYQIVARTTVTVRSAGTFTGNAISEFPAKALPIAVGQYAGVVLNPSAELCYGSSGAVGSLYNNSGDIGTATATFATGGPATVSYTVTVGTTPVDSYDLRSGAVAVPMAGYSPWKGMRFGLWAHSLGTPGYAYTGVTVGNASYTYWQQALCALLGMTWTFNDGEPGRGYYNFYTNYPNISLANLTAPSVGTTSGAGGANTKGGVNGGPRTSGTTLAQDLAPVDVMGILVDDNDYLTYPTGTITDGASAGTIFGNANNAIQILLAAKPTLRLVLIVQPFAPRWSTDSDHGLAKYQAMRAITQELGDRYGAPVVDLLSRSSFGPETWPLYLNTNGTDLHPNNVGWSVLTPIMAHAWNGF